METKVFQIALEVKLHDFANFFLAVVGTYKRRFALALTGFVGAGAGSVEHNALPHLKVLELVLGEARFFLFFFGEGRCKVGRAFGSKEKIFQVNGFFAASGTGLLLLDAAELFGFFGGILIVGAEPDSSVVVLQIDVGVLFADNRHNPAVGLGSIDIKAFGLAAKRHEVFVARALGTSRYDELLALVVH